MNELRNSKSDDQLEELLLLTEQMQEELDQKDRTCLLYTSNAIKNGATSVLEPELEPWGQRTCYIADPEGNLIEIGSWNKVYEQKDL